MEPTSIKNAGIDVKWDADGNIWLRHHDVDSEKFGRLREYDKEARHPGIKEALRAKGVDVDSPEFGELVPKIGGYIVLDGTIYIIDAEELRLVFETVKQHGGILPNWSTRV